MKRSLFAATGALFLMFATGQAFADVSWTRGEVKKVDLEQGKVTVKHEEIKSLDMPSMTMVFTTTDPTMLKDLAPGQTAEFEFADANGRIVIKQIRR
jgi:Cu/Ag efflux protein CusF